MKKRAVPGLTEQGYLPGAEAAARAGVDPSHLYRLVREGRIDGLRHGARSVFVKRTSLVAYLGVEVATRLGLTTPLPGEAEAAAVPSTETP